MACVNGDRLDGNPRQGRSALTYPRRESSTDDDEVGGDDRGASIAIRDDQSLSQERLPRVLGQRPACFPASKRKTERWGMSTRAAPANKLTTRDSAICARPALTRP